MDQSAIFLRQNILRAVTRLRQCCTENIDAKTTGFTENQFKVISLIYKLNREHPDGCSVKQLAEKLHITSAAVSEMIDLLVARGSVERRPHPHDRRSVALALTCEWQQKFLLADHQFNLLLSEFIGNLEGHERATIIRCAEKFCLFANQKLKSGHKNL